MSNLSGNVDIAREQERRARLQLLDEIREPSPQPIFGEPVKVELEDETSRRIKNTLGDFTQVLRNDSKALLGISRHSSSASGQIGRVQIASKRPSSANGMYKPINSKPSGQRDKRLGFLRNKAPEPPIICPSFQNNGVDTRLKESTSNLQRKHSLNTQYNGNAPNIPLSPNCRFTSFCPNNSSSAPSKKAFQVTLSPALKYGESSLPPRRLILRPNIKLPEKVWKPEKQPAESPIELETILREMKQAVPPPLTAIQTPRTEESGFAFPEDPKEAVFSSKVKELSPTPEPVPHPQPADPPKLKEINSCQSTPSPLGPIPPKMASNGTEPEIIEINSPLETEKATELLESLLCISSSLHDDLEMSDSDDEVQEIKVTSAELPKSSIKTPNVNPTNISTPINGNIDAPKDAVDSSSSSESGDSDSDDSSSESNDSDSSASSEDEASDADTPSKMWGLSNFFDDSRRLLSPAFVPMDTCTNSSTTAVKEEHVAVPTNPKESYTLVDDDSGNGLMQDPVAEPISNFLELETSMNIKNEVLSPITSPVQPLPPQTQPPPLIIRGPRTPPSPSHPLKDELVETDKACTSSGKVLTDLSVIADLTVSQIQINKPSNFQQISCDNKEDTGKVQIAAAKKHRLSKSKSETFSPRNESSPVLMSIEDEPSASKGMCDDSLNKDNDVTSRVIASSCSVPSETVESSHENYSIKTRQKYLKSSNIKKSKSVSEESPSESGQKGNKTIKSLSLPKFKHPARTCRVSTETKQLSKIVKGSVKSDLQEIKKPFVKSDIKERSNSGKIKVSPKSFSNTKGLSKTCVKLKKKPQKFFPKQITEGKKSEVKRKKNKFHIENFLQSPTVSQSETGQLSKVSPVLSPSLDKSPVSDYKTSSDIKKKPSASPSNASQSPTKSTQKLKNYEKLRRSARCSERASSTARSEFSEAFQQDSDVGKKIVKGTPKLKEQCSSPIHLEVPPLLLSPIPHSSIPIKTSEFTIPTKIMVCIPLDKLARLPIPTCAFDSDNKSVYKNKLPHLEESKKVMLIEKTSKNVINKHSIVKKIKDKPRTDVKLKVKTKSGTVNVKDKTAKSLSEPLTSKSKMLNMNCKTNIKNIDSIEIKVSKKRKSEEDKQIVKKKPKTNAELNHDKIQLPAVKADSPSHQTDPSNKSKSLERCDSVSSLSSLGSQISQKSSKERKSSTVTVDNKRGNSIKYIKQEKEEKVKTAIKKEPGTPDKNKEKSRDKLMPKDIDQKPFLGPLWSVTSSQYCTWDDACKEDSKGSLPITSSLQTSVIRSAFDWDNFGHIISKDIKESTNKHNNPIMPMDYFYTEGRKQKHLAEREKDPFLQTLKYFEATVLFILTSQQREEYTKEPESVYQFYRETLNFSNIILQNVRIQQSSPGSTEFKLLILLLRCQALLHVKLYSLKIKEIKEQQKNVSDFFMMHCPHTVKSLSNPTPQNPRLSLASIPSPHSPAPSPTSSVNLQTSGYNSNNDVGGNHMRGSFSMIPQINVTQSMLEYLCRQHTHLINLHMGHVLWEQADMYMTRSNLREFFKEVADQSENLTLHSSIKDLVNYIQAGITLVKKCSR